ncbi:hypothetical protein [Peptoniphilus timonensis]|uniref:hypothetical protein n=1 Tax=Peptoniphilus timonensis TaxID=1268254 RepID=UPI0002E9E908|nr:hypothetical protein [Peptoniphilus timonensis]
MDRKVEYIEILTEKLNISEFLADDFLNAYESFYENTFNKEFNEVLDLNNLTDFEIFKVLLKDEGVFYSITLDLSDLLLRSYVGDKLVDTEFFESFEELIDFLYVSDYEAMMDYNSKISEEIQKQSKK